MRLLFVLTAFVFSSCVVSNHFVEKNYENRTFDNVSLNILLDTASTTVPAHDGVREFLGQGEPKATFLTFLDTTLIKYLSDHVKASKISSTQNYNTAFEEKVYYLDNGEKLKVRLPKKGQTLLPEFADADLVLFLTNCVFEAGNNEITMNASGKASGGGSDVRGYVMYTLWDNKKGEVVSFGKTFGFSTSMFKLKKGMWPEMVNSLGSNLVKRLPLPVIK